MTDTVTVPREPNENILEALRFYCGWTHAAEAWHAALAAAPPSEPGEVERLARDYNELRETYDERVAELRATVWRLTRAAAMALKSIGRFPGSVHDRAASALARALGDADAIYPDPEAELAAAIATVERLTGELAACEQNCKDFNEAGLEALRRQDKALADAAFWKNLADELQDDCDGFADRADRLQAHVERLTGALRPFAAIKPSSLYSTDGSDGEKYTTHLCIHPSEAELIEFTGNDLRRAREALASLSGDGDGWREIAEDDQPALDTDWLLCWWEEWPDPASWGRRAVKTKAGFQIGDRVEKFTGDYQLAGEVRAVFTTRAGKVRYVVEHPVGSGGFLHIYSEVNLRKEASGG